MNNTIEGTKYEIYVKNFLSNNYESIWLWNEIPHDILKELNLVSSTGDIFIDDIGCDILAKTHDGTYNYIQCKNYSTLGINNKIQLYENSV